MGKSQSKELEIQINESVPQKLNNQGREVYTWADIKVIKHQPQDEHNSTRYGRG
jgi:hypothetical protein